MIVTVIALAAAVAAYVLMLRPILRAQPRFAALTRRTDGLWARLAARLKGWRTILWARLLVLVGLLLPLLDAARGIDLATLLPPAYVGYAPLLLAVIGVVTEALRRITTTPVGGSQPEP